MALIRSSANGRFNDNRNGLASIRPAVLTVTNLLVLVLASAVRAAPVATSKTAQDGVHPKDPRNASLWVYLSTAVVLVLLGGAFAGLTIALMGQDEIYLQVIATSGEGAERKNAKRVLRLLKKGKHWVLVTLLLSNVITNETLPIVLDRSLGGGWPAVLSSTVLIVIFGEIVPQSICVRYGLPIGAWCSPLVLALMWIMAPVAWPTAKLLDKLLGEDHGTTYKKAGLKTLVTLHKTLGNSPSDRLNEDEVTIISAVLDLKDKPVGSIMTPMNDVFILSADTVLDEEMMDTILSAGYSRIPIHTPENNRNFVGMLLVKMLITYDPEDALRVRDFALATLPETRPETSCLDIVNFFQEGKSHMVLVSDYPGESYGALGVVTLEDVIEELIGEEIIDESDVFVDVHKAIRRLAPAPRMRIPKGQIVTDSAKEEADQTEEQMMSDSRHPSIDAGRSSNRELSSSPRTTTFLIRRRSAGNGSIDSNAPLISVRGTRPEIQEHLKHLGPSNAANRPKQTRINTVKIKPGIPPTIHESASKPQPANGSRHQSLSGSLANEASFHESILNKAGRPASDGALALHQSYGTIGKHSSLNGDTNGIVDEEEHSPRSDTVIIQSRPKSHRSDSNRSQSTLASLPSVRSSSPRAGKRMSARSGSITENVIDLGGVRKVILETTSSSDDDVQLQDARRDGGRGGSGSERAAKADATQTETEQDEDRGGDSKRDKAKKKRKKRAGKKKKGASSGNGDGESDALLGDDR